MVRMIGQQLLHIFQIMLRVYHLLDVIPAEAKPVAPVGVLDDSVLFRMVHQPVVDPQGDMSAVCQLSENGLFLG